MPRLKRKNPRLRNIELGDLSINESLSALKSDGARRVREPQLIATQDSRRLSGDLFPIPRRFQYDVFNKTQRTSTHRDTAAERPLAGSFQSSRTSIKGDSRVSKVATKIRIDEHEGYRLAEQKHRDITTRFLENRSRQEEINSELAGMNKTPRVPELDRAALRLLRGEQGPDREEALRDELSSLTKDEPILERAVALAGEDRKRARREASTDICTQVRGEHEELARDIAKALEDLRRVLIAEAEFRDESGGVDFRLPLVAATFTGEVGTKEDGFSGIDRWFTWQKKNPLCQDD